MRFGPKNAAISGVFVLTGVVGALGLVWSRARNPPDAIAGPPTAKVIRRDVASSVLATGAVRPQVGAEVRVGARISGRLAALHANVGDEVEEGQVIAELEKADLEATVTQRRVELKIAKAQSSALGSLRPAEIERAEAVVAQREATALLANKELAQQRELFSQELISRQVSERAQERLAVAEAQLESARKSLELARTQYVEDLEQAQANVERADTLLTNARIQRSYATIAAPIAGVVASVSTQEGETVAAGLSAPTFVTIIDLNRLQVDAYVDEVDIGKVKVGQRAAFAVDAFPAREFEGKVVAIYPKAVIQNNVVNYDVVIDITTEHRDLLMPEMTASVTIFLESRPGVLSVPAKAMVRKNGRNFVYVETGGQVLAREVKVGSKDGDWIEIAGGLEEGQTVLMTPPENEDKQ